MDTSALRPVTFRAVASLLSTARARPTLCHLRRSLKKMSSPLQEDLAEAWITAHSSSVSPEERDKNFWAYGRLYCLVLDSPHQAWTAILTILDKDASEDTMMNLAAGPLEDLLSKHGPEVIDRVEKEAHANPTFSNLLGGVWQSGTDDQIWKRIERVRDLSGWDDNPSKQENSEQVVEPDAGDARK